METIRLVKCEICGKEMKMRLNGSHLRTHNITIHEYLEIYPNADVGEYRVSDFACKICDENMSGSSETIRCHLRSHNLTRDEYNLEYEKKYCKCGCGELTEYSYPLNKYKEYIEGHCPAWNLGLTKETDARISKIFSRKFLWTQIKSPENDIIRQRQADSCRKTYSEGKVDIEGRSRKYAETMLKNYGVSNYFSSKEFREYIIKYNLDKYGVESQMQDPEVFMKNKKTRRDYRDYVCPSGDVRRIQGYEDMALDILLKDYNESEIIDCKSKIPDFFYYLDGKKKRYYPDIYIPSENKIIEIKSWWTYNKEVNRDLKKQSVLDSGYKYEFWIFNSRKHKQLIIL